VPAGCDYSGNLGFESQVINLINQERSNRGLTSLTQNNQLRQAARGHSQDMACNDFFSHTGSDGSSMGSRILAAGYSYSWAAENIAASSSGGYSPQSVVSGWMNSTGHRKNILNENAKHIGIGFRYVSDGDPGDLDAYYTANFGQP
jgi:serralysin